MLYDVVSNCASSWYQPVNAPEPDMQPEPIGHGFMFTHKFIIYAIICSAVNFAQNAITIHKSICRDMQIYAIP